MIRASRRSYAIRIHLQNPLFAALFGVWLTITGSQSLLSDERQGGEPIAPNEQELLLFGSLEPIHVKLLIDVDGVPFRTVWRNVVDRVFDQFDTDKDGKLTPEQSKQLISVFVSTTAGGPANDKSAMMRDANITREELRKYLEQIAPPVTLRQRLSSGGAGIALVPLLDMDGDGRLSKEELQFAEQSLHGRDFNDDQLIVKTELLAGPNLASTVGSDEYGITSGSLMLLNPSIDSKAVSEILLSRYDRNRDGLLSLAVPAEILSSDDRIRSLDRDGNNSLDRDELRGYLTLPLDATLAFSFGGSTARDATKKLSQALPHYRLSSKYDGGHRLHVGASEIAFGRSNRDPAQDSNRPRFQDFDADMSKMIDEAEYANVPDRPDFVVVDTDKDGKLTEAEFDAYFLQRYRAAAVQLVLEISDQGSDLFTAMDQNGDQVLSPRELHFAAKLLETEDRDGDGFLGDVEMSFRLKLMLSRGGSRPTTANNVLIQRGSAEPQVRGDRSGPAWFTKMDRNKDGDISIYEFVGSREIFTTLDRNGDGLISVDEAKCDKPE